MQTQIPSSVPLTQLLQLSVPEKLALIGALSDSIELLPIPDWQLEELRRRDEMEETSSEPVIAWDDAVKQVKAAHAQRRSP